MGIKNGGAVYMSLGTIIFILNIVGSFIFGLAMANLSDNKMKWASRLMIISYVCSMSVIAIILFKLNLM